MECKPCDSKKLCKVFDASNRLRKKNGIDNSDTDTDASKSVVVPRHTSKQLLDTELRARSPVEKKRSSAGSSSAGSRACAAHRSPPPAPRHPHASTPHTNRRKGGPSLALKPGVASSPRSESPEQTPRSVLQTETPANVPEADEGSTIYDFLEQALKKKRHRHHSRRHEDRSADTAEPRDARHHRRKSRRPDDHGAEQLIETFVEMYSQLQDGSKTKEADVIIQKTKSNKSLQCQYKIEYSDIDRKPSKLEETPLRGYRNKNQSREKLSECGSRYNAEIAKKNQSTSLDTPRCSNLQRQEKYATDYISRNCEERSSREPIERTYDERRKERYKANIDDEKPSRDRYSEKIYDDLPSKERYYSERIYDERPSRDRNSERIFNRTSKERYNEKFCCKERKDICNGRNYGKNYDGNRIYENTQRDQMYDGDRYTHRRRSDIERDRYENYNRYSPKKMLEYRDKNGNLHRDSDTRRCEARYSKMCDRDSVQSVDSMVDGDPSSELYEPPIHLRNDASSLCQKNQPGKGGITDPAIQHEVAEQRQALGKMMGLWQELMERFKDITDNVGRSERVVQETAVAAREGAITQMQLWRECMQRYESVARDVGDTDARLKEELQKQKTEITEMSGMWQECLARYREMSSHLTSLKQQINVEQTPPPVARAPAAAPPAAPGGEGSPTPYPYAVPPPVYPMYGSPMRARASAPAAGPPPPPWWYQRGCGSSPLRPRRPSSLESRSEHSRSRHHKHRERERDKHHGKERSTSKVNISRSERRRKK